ncbi:MAG: hypothetical protein O3B04_10410 [Chloroflexi bacterium]|nr:hypothetical protein [Chloroflexota bacterium]
MSYVIRRVFVVKPGSARKVATTVAKQAKLYEEAGQRSPCQVYFNGGTVPGEKDRVYMEWTADVIESPYREGNVIPQSVRDAGTSSRDLIEGSHIEFYELLTPAKFQD